MEKSYLDLAKKELGEDAVCEESQDQAYVLCKYINKNAQLPMTTNRGGTTQGGLARVKYFVWNTSKGVVVTQGTLAAGNIVWHSNTEVKIVETKGANLPADVFLYNVVTQKKSQLDK